MNEFTVRVGVIGPDGQEVILNSKFNSKREGLTLEQFSKDVRSVILEYWDEVISGCKMYNTLETTGDSE